jgi:hypothetical protein
MRKGKKMISKEMITDITMMVLLAGAIILLALVI